MSFPKYYVTYCVMDMEAGANPFGHSCLIFSQQKTEQSAVEAVDCIGFYSQPSTTTDPLVKTGKKLLGFSIDLQDGHGMLKQELMRELDIDGLHGVSFPVSKEQFEQMSANYKEIIRVEQETIKELNNELTQQGIEPNGYTRHLAEKEKAQKEGRAPRLLPFHVTMQFKEQGFDSSASHTCKDRALELLLDNGVINHTIKNQIHGSRVKKAFPRFSSLELAPIRLISMGEPQEHVAKSKNMIYYNRVWGKNTLFWATPTQTMDDLSAPKQEDIDYPALKEVLKRIHDVELLIRKQRHEVQKDGTHQKDLARLDYQLQQVQKLYPLFTYTSNKPNELSFDNKLAFAHLMLDAAILYMNPDRIDGSFLLRALQSTAGQDALLGAAALLISIGVLFIAPVVGAALLTAATLLTAQHAYSFYKEELLIAQTQPEHLESGLAISP